MMDDLQTPTHPRLIAIDLANPTRPVLAERFWPPETDAAARKTPDWPLPNSRSSLHDPIAHGDVAYCSRSDAGLLVVADEPVFDHQENGPKLIWIFNNERTGNPAGIATALTRDRDDTAALHIAEYTL